jgi:hypothetical protein
MTMTASNNYSDLMLLVYDYDGTPVTFTNITDCHDITEILLKVALNTISITLILNGLFLSANTKLILENIATVNPGSLHKNN